MACVADREAAVREVAQVYELIKLQQPLLLLPSPQHSPQVAQSLLSKALRALNVALSVMKQQPQPAAAPVTPTSVVVKAEPHHQLSPPSPAAFADSQAMAPRRCAKRRRSSIATTEGKKKSSWTTETAVPYDDGYEWRKYGEKKINGAGHTRSYFRCTYKDDAGCLATKHVQQTDNNSDPPMFHVIYNNDHTCNTASAKAAHVANNNLVKQEQTGQCAAAAAMNTKQEPPQLLPALMDLQHQQPSACFPHEQIPQCQEPMMFPVISMDEQQFCGALRDDDGEIPSATGSSCISGETASWDGYSGYMAAAEDDPLHDLERFLLMDY